MCTSVLPMNMSKPTPMPLSTSAKVTWESIAPGPAPGCPAAQLAPALQENEPPPFSRRLQLLATLQTPRGNILKYLSIHPVTLHVSCADSPGRNPPISGHTETYE